MVYKNFSINERDKREITIEKEIVTWQDVENFIKYLESKCDIKSFTGVYGPARGGVIFATIISNRYGLPYLGAPQQGCLVVDDIVDGGDTALAWNRKGYTIATMYYNKNAKVEPDIWWKEKNDKWIKFAWE